MRIALPIHPLRPAATSRKPHYDLSRMMRRNFDEIGRRQVDMLVASVL